MSSEYEYSVVEYASSSLCTQELRALHQELKDLGGVCFDPLPRYQVFTDDMTNAFQDKIIVVARHGEKVVAFVSAVVIPIANLPDPVIHSGLTVIHPDHRRAYGVIQLLHYNLWMHLFSAYPHGFWMTCLAEVISSLVHMSKYAINVYPSPQWLSDHPSGEPGETQLLIAKEISAKHRGKMLISCDAEFEEQNFIFKGSNNHAAAHVFMKDTDDARHWHRDTAASAFYRRLFRRNEGDEVLQVGFMDPNYLADQAQKSAYKAAIARRASKL
ncbi:hypothetical protein NQ176_g5192 [Zarea fungicola]|uniref:Uncharacterized protein n=1 Tax=Zarea fungicola TaxID=93591 RepID=A0ACC1N9P1_9HYPO|nr:hypothetical protein NQ176_g5192 [Lecanicillium fungicola]